MESKPSSSSSSSLPEFSARRARLEKARWLVIAGGAAKVVSMCSALRTMALEWDAARQNRWRLAEAKATPPLSASQQADQPPRVQSEPQAQKGEVPEHPMVWPPSPWYWWGPPHPPLAMLPPPLPAWGYDHHHHQRPPHEWQADPRRNTGPLPPPPPLPLPFPPPPPPPWALPFGVAPIPQFVKPRSIEDDFLSRFVGAGGTSIGAALAFAVMAGVSFQDLEQFVCDVELWSHKNLFEDTASRMASSASGSTLTLADLSEFLDKSSMEGFSSHEPLYRNIDNLLQLACLPRDITFDGLLKMRPRGCDGGKRSIDDDDEEEDDDLSDVVPEPPPGLMCNGVCIDDGSMFYASSRHTSHMAVRDALCMSMCVLGIFEPFRWEGRNFGDGGHLCNYIIHKYPAKTTVGITPVWDAISSEPPPRGSTFADRNDQPTFTGTWRTPFCRLNVAANITSHLSSKINREILDSLTPDQRAGTIMIRTPGFEGLLISINQEEINALWRMGRNAALAHFGSEIPKDAHSMRDMPYERATRVVPSTIIRAHPQATDKGVIFVSPWAGRPGDASQTKRD
ncbi:Patatin-like phospholipase [Mollivirus sibericum]|uniref:Patatin-like phospholipase n=1 Tax=Mollivirus sibericum TaxID=1678078 RepID=UPI0006B2DF7E|nr:Patatin-like phospholipase [Mollivirus sibericum]ALD62203.1 Patatin-like phospholipase [Mollivirus sibericum]